MSCKHATTVCSKAGGGNCSCNGNHSNCRGYEEDKTVNEEKSISEELNNALDNSDIVITIKSVNNLIQVSATKVFVKEGSSYKQIGFLKNFELKINTDFSNLNLTFNNSTHQDKIEGYKKLLKEKGCSIENNKQVCSNCGTDLVLMCPIRNCVASLFND